MSIINKVVCKISGAERREREAAELAKKQEEKRREREAFQREIDEMMEMLKNKFSAAEKGGKMSVEEKAYEVLAFHRDGHSSLSESFCKSFIDVAKKYGKIEEVENKRDFDCAKKPKAITLSFSDYEIAAINTAYDKVESAKKETGAKVFKI